VVLGRHKNAGRSPASGDGGRYDSQTFGVDQSTWLRIGSEIRRFEAAEIRPVHWQGVRKRYRDHEWRRLRRM
jgi:hypothetical protein